MDVKIGIGHFPVVPPALLFLVVFLSSI